VSELEPRASDDDRERAALQLREHVVAGRLTLEEFSERLDHAYTARTTAQLEELTRDLPTEAARRRATRLTAVVFGDVERKGRWRLARSSLAIVVFGNADLDLRNAEIDGEVSSLTALVLFGNVDLYAPPAVEVEVGGVSVLGHRREWGDAAPRRNAPLVHIRVLSLFGTTDVWRVPAELGAVEFREVIRALRAGG
jgi:hypothetical protein